jgi:hypothetical protein
MASGVDINNQSAYLTEVMTSVMLDYDLAEYYKLMANLHMQTKNVDKAKECVEKYLAIIVPELGDAGKVREEELKHTMANLDKWKLEIDMSSIPRKTGGLIRRPKKSK